MSTEPFAITPSIFASSDLFERTFSEGMELVEETAAYLEGPGRQEAKDLPRSGALAYASESMRLTTRLMQIASWLLVHQAVRNGEMTDEDACSERYRLCDIAEENRDPRDDTTVLPNRLKDIANRADTLFRRVSRLDARLFETSDEPAGPTPNPVALQIQALHKALNPTAGDA